MKNSEIKKLSWADKLRYCRYGDQGLSAEHEFVRVAMESDRLGNLVNRAARQSVRGDRRSMEELARIQLSLAGDVFDTQRWRFLLVHHHETLRLNRTPTASEVETRYCGGGDTKRFRKELDLPFLDGQYLRALRSQLRSQREKLGRMPTRREFLQFVAKDQVDNLPLSSLTLEEVLGLMAEPMECDWTLRWSLSHAYLPHLRQLRVQAGSIPIRHETGGSVLYSMLSKLGSAFEEINLGEADVVAKRSVLQARIRREAEVLGRFPRVADLVGGWDSKGMTGLSVEIGLTTEERALWGRLNSFLGQAPGNPTLASLCAEFSEFYFLADILHPVLTGRDPVVLYESMVAN